MAFCNSTLLCSKQTAGLLLRSCGTRGAVSNQQFINMTGAVSRVYAKYFVVIGGSLRIVQQS